MNINKIDFTRMRNDEHFQFHVEFRALVHKYDAAKLNIAAQFQTYLPLFDREDTALKKIMKSAVTAEIQAADKERDNVFRGMTDAQKAALKHFDPQVQAAARRRYLQSQLLPKQITSSANVWKQWCENFDKFENG